MIYVFVTTAVSAILQPQSICYSIVLYIRCKCRVETVKSLPVLQYSVGHIYWSFVISGSITRSLKSSPNQIRDLWKFIWGSLLRPNWPKLARLTVKLRLFLVVECVRCPHESFILEFICRLWKENNKTWLTYTCFTSSQLSHSSIQYKSNLFVLMFYGTANPVGSCRARSVYLTTRLMGRLSPLSS